MEVSNKLILFIFSLYALLFQLTHSATVVVDGVSKWENPTVQVGDSIIFEHRYHYNLYIFQNRRAFNLCNFTQATLLTKSNSTSFTWHPSRLGFFYFSFNNASNKPCEDGQKLAVEVTSSLPENITNPSKQPPVTSPPSSGGIASASPAYPWPFRPHGLTSPSPAPINIIFPATSPSGTPGKGKTNGLPFINSNPAVPLPTGEVDSAIIRPLPTSGHVKLQVVGFVAVQRAVCCVVLLMLL